MHNNFRCHCHCNYGAGIAEPRKRYYRQDTVKGRQTNKIPFASVFLSDESGGNRIMPTTAQLKKIHALRSDLRINEENYRSLLSAYHCLNDGSVETSAELSVHQASTLINALEHMIDRSPEVRSRVYASDRQLKLMFALWHTITGIRDTTGTRKSLQAFLEHHFHIHDINHIPKKKMPKIIYPLSIMARQRGANRFRSGTASNKV